MSTPLKQYKTLYTTTLRLAKEFISLPGGDGGPNLPGQQSQDNSYGHAILNVCGNGDYSQPLSFLTRNGHMSVLQYITDKNFPIGSLAAAAIYLDDSGLSTTAPNSSWFTDEVAKLKVLCGYLGFTYSGPTSISQVILKYIH